MKSYVNDTTVLEVIPRNFISMLDIAVRDIQEYCISHKMKWNPKKCKKMVIKFMANPNTVMRPICIGNQVVETVKTYKLLRITIREDLEWNSHIDCIIAKAAKPLYALRLLKGAGVNPHDILKVYMLWFNFSFFSFVSNSLWYISIPKNKTKENLKQG